MIPLGDATTLRFTEPIFVGIFAFLILREPCGILQVFTSIITVVGVVIMGRPPFLFGDNSTTYDINSIIGISLALGSSLLASFISITMRKLQKTPPPITIFWFSLTGILYGLATTPIFGKLIWPTQLRTWLLLAGLSFFVIINQLFLTLSLKYEKANPVAIVRSSSIVLAFVYQITIMDEMAQWTSFLGAAIILGCVIVVGVAKWYEDSENSQHNLDELKYQDKNAEGIITISYNVKANV